MFTTANESVSRTVIGTLGTAIFAGICLFGATAPAAAAEAPRAATVSYSDLNLANAHGRDALSLRIRTAARSVCTNGSNDVRGRTEAARCVRTAVDGAQAKLAPFAVAYKD